MFQTTIDEHKQQYIEGDEKDFIDLFIHELMTQKTTKSGISVFTGTYVQFITKNVQGVQCDDFFHLVFVMCELLIHVILRA